MHGKGKFEIHFHLTEFFFGIRKFDKHENLIKKILNPLELIFVVVFYKQKLTHGTLSPLHITTQTV